MLRVECRGSPYEIGYQHGQAAQQQVKGSILFYRDLFFKTTKLSWSQVEQEACRFLPLLEADWPHLVQEMQGLADAGGSNLESILSLNVRTEIAYGMFNDGCTAFSWKSGDESFLAQNWDVG